MVAGVFEVLERDHVEVKQMCDALERGRTAASGATETELVQRRKLAERLIIEESKHEAVEEQYFWPFVRSHVADGERLADEATGQESSAKYVLDALEKKKPQDPEFESLLARFLQEGREHIAYEESQVWPRLRAVISDDESADLAAKIERGKEKAPTRPHPGTPPRPRVLKTAGAGAALLDKVRDAVTRRGKE